MSNYHLVLLAPSLIQAHVVVGPLNQAQSSSTKSSPFDPRSKNSISELCALPIIEVGVHVDDCLGDGQWSI